MLVVSASCPLSPSLPPRACNAAPPSLPSSLHHVARRPPLAAAGPRGKTSLSRSLSSSSGPTLLPPPSRTPQQLARHSPATQAGVLRPSLPPSLRRSMQCTHRLLLPPAHQPNAFARWQLTAADPLPPPTIPALALSARISLAQVQAPLGAGHQPPHPPQRSCRATTTLSPPLTHR